MGTRKLSVWVLVSLVLHSAYGGSLRPNVGPLIPTFSRSPYEIPYSNFMPLGRSQSPCGEKDNIFVEFSLPVDLKDCEEVCKVSEACKFYTWLSSKNESSGEISESCGIRTYSPNALVNGATEQIVASKADEFSQITGQVFVGKAFRIPEGNSLKCQLTCQGNDDCQSWTWNAEQSFNPEVCVHNYGKTENKLPVPVVPGVTGPESGPKYCPASITEISTRTGSRSDASSLDPVTITICDKSQACCSTILDNPGIVDRKRDITYTYSEPDVLGDCFNFVPKKGDLSVTLSKVGNDRWDVVWTKIKFAGGVSVRCNFNFIYTVSTVRCSNPV